ncbi:hypothetical protein EB796_023245 [Bugula neritina]|uniref:Uncharacterized protein n=1 Tax=Bugula neritina TaxID=10212 RepID=A0A7J7IX55_BUGNE|nr:hypothetical protein EB796_023245 [Bugula neritina]
MLGLYNKIKILLSFSPVFYSCKIVSFLLLLFLRISPWLSLIIISLFLRSVFIQLVCIKLIFITNHFLL